MSKPAPPWLDDEAALVLIDWSSWLHKAWAIGGVDSMVSLVVGWLTGVLADRPAHLALALDAPPPTHRHRVQHPHDEGWRYKAGRAVKPEEFFALCETCTQLAELHALPTLWAPEREADDVIATATAKAREAGYRVWICSPDKDLASLVEADERSGILVGTWDNFGDPELGQDPWRGPAEVIAKFHVRPAQMPDYLAIAGDGVDAVPGVPSLGGTKAALLLAQFGTLEAALAAEPWTAESYATWEGEAKALAKRRKITSDPDVLAKIDTTRAHIQTRIRCAKAHAVLVEHAAIARFSRVLTALDCGAPIRIDWHALPVGGFDVEGLRRRYASLGFGAKARQVPEHPKRAPWALPFEDG